MTTSERKGNLKHSAPSFSNALEHTSGPGPKSWSLRRRRIADGLADTALPFSKKLRRGTSLLDIPTDIFLYSLLWLDISEVLSLRMVCKSLESITRLHTLWSTLASLHVINKNLPWPAWARPLGNVPSATLEDLTLRAVRMTTLWDDVNRNFDPAPSRFIQQPRDSVTWLYLIFSRWLVIQTKAEHLELWDLEKTSYEEPALVIQPIDGIVDGFVFRSQTVMACTLMISTRTHKTIQIRLHLPRPKETRVASISAEIINSFEGFSKLKDADDLLASFLHYNGEDSLFVRNLSTGAVVELASETFTRPLQVHAVQLNSQVIAVATAKTLDIYQRSDILAALHAPNGRQQLIQPNQRIPFIDAKKKRDGEFFVLGASFLTPDSVGRGLLPEETRTISLCVVQDGVQCGGYYYRHEAHPIEDMDVGLRYDLLPPTLLFWEDPYDVLFCCTGDSARRAMLVADDPQAGLVLVGVNTPANLSQPVKGQSENWIAGWWSIPDAASHDLVHHLVFDEATGTGAVAMGSGRVWVTFPTRMPVAPEGSWEDFRAPVMLIADPAWPMTHPKWPAIADVKRGRREHPGHFKPDEWTAEIEPYFPLQNQPECFGGMTWFTNEVLNIPGPSRCLFINTPAPRGRTCWDIRVFTARGRLFSVEWDEMFDSHFVCMFHDDVTLEEVVAELLQGNSVWNLRGQHLMLKSAPLSRYSAWRKRVYPGEYYSDW